MSLVPAHWRRGDACDVRGARGRVDSFLSDGMVVVEFARGVRVTVSHETLEMPALPPVDEDERLFTRREWARR